MWTSLYLRPWYLAILACASTIGRCTAQGTGGPPQRSPQQQEIRLPLGDINVVVLTDTHSWVGGHGDKEPHLDADYGTVLSFYQLLKDKVRLQDDPGDLWFVMNGDWIDGTGLALNGDISRLVPLLEKMPWDAVNVGNHELYLRSVVEGIMQTSGFAEWFGPKYLTTNVLVSSTQQPLGNRYRVLHGRKSNVLTFGFLYNMKHNDPTVTVVEVQSIVEEDWFADALLEEEYDAIMVLAHMDHQDGLVKVILQKIRALVGNEVPCQFITGHTHYRGFSTPDANSASFEPGRYLDTVGFVSFPTRNTLKQLANNTQAADLFKHRFINASYEELSRHVGEDPMATEDGLDLSEFIHRVQRELGLREIIGCIEQSYYLERGMEEQNSLWGLFVNQVVPHVFGPKAVVHMGNSAWRYDLFQGDVTLDEVIAVSPYNNSLMSFQNLPGSVIEDFNLANGWMARNSSLPNYVLATGSGELEINPNQTYNFIVSDFSLPEVSSQLEQVYPEVSNITTRLLPHTTTSIWHKFISETQTCQTPKRGKHKEKTPTKHSRTHHRTNHTGLGSMNFTETASDKTLIKSAMVAIGVAVLLTAIHVWQRGRHYRRTVYAREMATMAALEEYEERDNSRYTDDVPDEADPGWAVVETELI